MIAVLPAYPTIIFVTVLPIPTDFAPSKYFTLDNSRFLFSTFLGTEYVNSVSNLVTNVPEACVAGEVELCPLLSLYLLLTSSWFITKNCSESIWTTSFTLNFRLTVGSENVMNVVIPVVARFAIASDKPEVTVDNPMVLTPSIFLYEIEDIPDISTMSPPERPWGTVDKPVTSPSSIENFKLSTIVFVVPTDTIDLPTISSTLAVIVASLKVNISFTLYPVPDSLTVTFVIVEESTPSTFIIAFEFNESSSKGYLLNSSFNPKWVTFLL